MQIVELLHIPRRAENIQWRQFGTDGILLDPASGDYFELNEMGLMIWAAIDGQRTIGEIVEELAAQFNGDDSDLVLDAKEFLTELMTKGLITVAVR